ncbi:MAG: hypothetical protein ACC618_03840, partial [Patescibacteria group bacterium]
FTKDLQHYLPLVGILFVGGFGFFYFSYDRMFQAGIALSVAVSYFAWGLVHHYLHRDLHLSVVLEYIAISALGVMVIFSLLFTA